MIDEATLREVLSDYLAPLYQFIGAAMAALVILLALYVVLWPFLRNVRFYSRSKERD